MPTIGGITLRDSSPAERAMGIAEDSDEKPSQHSQPSPLQGYRLADIVRTAGAGIGIDRAQNGEWQPRSKPEPGTTTDKAVVGALASLKKSMKDSFFDPSVFIHSYPNPEPNMPCRRLITRVIYDPDTRITPDEAMIYVDARPVLTDNADADCWFDLDVLSLLAAHNEKRSKIKDVEESRKSGEFVGLPPTRLEDLVRIIR